MTLSLAACLLSSSPSASSLTSPYPFSTWSSCGSCNADYFSLRLKCCFRSLRNSNPNCKWEKWQENVLNGGKLGRRVAEWLGGEWCLSLTPRGVDGASLRSLVSHHQSLIPFIFSENNHFEATYGIRHDTTTERHGNGNDNVSHMLAKTHNSGGGSGFIGTGAHGKGFPYVVSRPALSNYQMDSASEISGHVKWLYWFPLLVTRDSGGFSLLRTLFRLGVASLRARQSVWVQVRLSWDNKKETWQSSKYFIIWLGYLSNMANGLRGRATALAENCSSSLPKIFVKIPCTKGITIYYTNGLRVEVKFLSNTPDPIELLYIFL